MTIQEKIGSRIREARKKMGLTMKELADLTVDLKPTRITNWERGTRTPGPAEAKELAKVLQVSPAYLLGLTDDIKAGTAPKVPGLLGIVPILDYKQALLSKKIIEDCKSQESDAYQFIPLGEDFKQDLTPHTFALRVKDESMSPDLNHNDIVIINPDKTPQPGAFVIAQIANQPEIVIRQYKQLSCDDSFEAFELIALNDKWANVTISDPKDARIIGVVSQATHVY